MRFKEGDQVKIIDREITPSDAKNGTFYAYFRGLAGVVDRMYDKEICVRVDPETLPEDVLKRHLDVQESIKRKWLNGLSGEARNRLTAENKKFELAYTILVQSTDLEKVKSGEPKPAAIKSVRPVNPPKERTSAAPVLKPSEEAPAQPVPKRSADSRPKASASTAKAEPKAAKTVSKPAAKPSPKPDAARAPKKREVEPRPDKPVTTADLTAAELAFLKERQKALKGKK